MIAPMASKKAPTPQPSPDNGRRSTRKDPFPAERFREWADRLQVFSAQLLAVAEGAKAAKIGDLVVDGAQGKMEDVFAILDVVYDKGDEAVLVEKRRRNRRGW